MLTIDQLLEKQNQSWSSGKHVFIEELLRESSMDLEQLTSDELLQLICNEVWHREQCHQVPVLNEYVERFPQVSVELNTQWEVDNLLAPRVAFEGSFSEQLPKTIGRYEVLREVGRGAAGVVYEAYDDRLNRPVAIKCLRSEPTRQANELQRFQLEAETLGKLEHPHILTVYDVGIDKGTLFIVAEFCQSGTISDLIADKPLPPKQAATFANQVASAVAAAHRMGIIHRDIKPANVLLSQKESGQLQCKVSDFGLAKWLDSDASTTLTGSIIGSPAYMAPEQARGDHSRVRTTTDVYAIGALLFQMLTGRPPFLSSTIADTLYQIEKKEPLQIRQLSPNTPIDLETIVSKCLRKDPLQRYENAQDLSDELQRFLDGKAILARPERVHQRLMRAAKNNPMLALMIVVSTLLLLSITVGSLWFSTRLSKALQNSQQSEREAQLEKATALLQHASGRRMSGLPGRRLIALESIREAVGIGRRLKQPEKWFDKFRDEAFETMWQPDLVISQWSKIDCALLSASISPDDRLIALMGSDHVLQIRDIQSDSRIASTTLEDDGTVIFYDLNHLVYVSRSSIIFFEIQPRKIVERWRANFDDVVNIWLQPSQNLIVAEVGSKLLFLNADSSTTRTEIERGQFSRPNVSVNPKLPVYLISSYHYQVAELRDLRDHKVLWRWQAENFGPDCALWSPDGLEFVFTGEDKLGRLFRLDMHFQPKLESTLDHRIGGGFLGCWTAGRTLLLVSSGSSHALMKLDSAYPPVVIHLQGSYWSDWRNSTLYSHNRSYLAVVPKHKPTTNEFGLLSVAMGDESKQLFSDPNIIAPGSFAVNSEDGWLVTPSHNTKPNVLHFSNLQNGLTHKLPLSGISVLRASLDQQDLHLTSPELSIRLKWECTNGKLRLSHAQRSSIHTGYGEICISKDGRSILSGLWNGYADAPYCGVWVQNRDEPGPRRLLAFESGKFNGIHPNSDEAILYYQGQYYKCDMATGNLSVLGSSTYASQIEYNRQGNVYIAGDKIWNTRDGSQHPLTDPQLKDSLCVSFSNDGQHVLCENIAGQTQLVDLQTGEVYLQMEGSVLFYDAVRGKAMVRTPSGIYLRHLDRVVSQLDMLGLHWPGPSYSVGTAPSFDGVELSEELSALSSYTDWMDHVDNQALEIASSDPEDGRAIFQAAMVQIERSHLSEARRLLEHAAELLPRSLVVHYWQSYVFGACGEWEAAIAEASPLIDRTNDPVLRQLRATWYLELGRADLALVDADEAEKVNSLARRRSSAIRVMAYRQLRNAEGEEENLKILDMRRPADVLLADTIYLLVTHDISLRNTRLARFYLERITERTHPNVVIAQAWCSLRSDAFQKAIETVRSFLDDRSGIHYCSSQILCAISEAKLGNYSSAEAHLAKAKQAHADPSHSAYGDRSTRLLIAEAEACLSNPQSSKE